jgi:hypothetical protein
MNGHSMNVDLATRDRARWSNIRIKKEETKETKMKKQLASLTLAAVISLIGGSSAYAFVSQQINPPITAKVTATGTKSASFSNVALRPIAAPEGAGANLTQIGWTAAAGTNWQLADSTLRFNFNVTDRLGGIQIYTNNTAATASPKFVDPTPTNLINADSNPAGLLLGTAGNSSERMDMAWSIKATSATVGVDVAPADPNNGALTGAASKFQWLYMLDKATPAIDRNGDGDVLDTDPVANPNADLRDTVAYVPGNDFSNVVKFTKIHFGQGPADYGVDSDKKAYIYFQANLDQAAPGDVFQTNTLTLEAFIN